MESFIPLVSFVVLFIVEFLFFDDDLKSGVEKHTEGCEFSNQSACSTCDETDDEVIRREHIETVMKKLGLFCASKDEKLKESLGSREISILFEEKEPSLEELKGAFDVFDENKDGFVDAEELQRVLRILGLKEGLDIQNCRMMIGAFDTSGDDRIDFNDFVKVMENGFC